MQTCADCGNYPVCTYPIRVCKWFRPKKGDTYLVLESRRGCGMDLLSTYLAWRMKEYSGKKILHIDV
jgi:hypothetical protein